MNFDDYECPQNLREPTKMEWYELGIDYKKIKTAGWIIKNSIVPGIAKHEIKGLFSAELFH